MRKIDFLSHYRNMLVTIASGIIVGGFAIYIGTIGVGLLWGTFCGIMFTIGLFTGKIRLIRGC